MKQIQKNKTIYRIKQDKRSFSLKFGRYLYLTVLTVLFLTIFHLAFSFLYILTGDGFVSADKESVAFEYDASLKTIFVENGDKVKKGQELFRYDSIDYRTHLIDLLFKQSNMFQELSKSDTHLKKIEAQLSVTEDQLKIAKDIVNKLEKLAKKKLASNQRRSVEYERYFDTLRDFNEQKAEKTALLSQYKKTKHQVDIISKNVKHLVDSFKEGLATSPADGVVGDLNHTAGNVIEKSTPVLKIFSNLRYLLVYFNSSYIEANVGDTMLIHIPGEGFYWGTAVDKDYVSSEIPEEIKPKFRPAQRRRAMIVMMDQKVTKHLPLMKSIQVYKPLGMDLIVDLFGIKHDHHKEYQELIKKRHQKLDRIRTEHSKSVQDLHHRAKKLNTLAPSKTPPTP